MIAMDIEGFETVPAPGSPGVRLVVASGRGPAVVEAGLADPRALIARATVERWVHGGRTPHPVVRIDGEAWLIKSYRRGGFVARCNDDLYFDSARFLRELEVCAQAIRAGVPTVAPIALVLQPAALGAVRAWLVVPFIDEARTLADVLKESARGEDAGGAGLAAFRAAGRVVRHMHRSGIDHPDLNLGNLLIVRDAGEPRVLIVDWDRARTHDREGDFAFGNLLRLFRSGRKLRRDSALLGRCVRGFLRGYFERSAAAPSPGTPGGRAASDSLRALGRLREYVRRKRWTEILLHPVYWRRT